jgi:ATP-binding cassette, subfamily B, bacterial
MVVFDVITDTTIFSRPQTKAQTRVGSRRAPDETLAAISWPLRQLGDGLAALAVAALQPSAQVLDLPASVLNGSEETFAHWLDWAGDTLAIELEEVEAGVADLGSLLKVVYPAMVRVRGSQGPLFVLIVARRGDELVVLAPDRRRRRLSIETLQQHLTAPHTASQHREIDKLLGVAGVKAARRPAVAAAMAHARLGATPVDGIWSLRQSPSAPFGAQLKGLRLPLRLAGVTATMIALYGLEITAWGIIGGSILSGRLDFGALAAWSLLLVSMVPLQGAAVWLNARMAAGFGALLKSRLLSGALRLDPELTRRQGAGHLLARVMESQAFEALAISGGLSALVAVIELGFSFWLLASGAGGLLLVVLLGLTAAVAVALGVRFFHRLDAWTDRRLELTHGLIERMVGHRTILAQQSSNQRHAAEREMTAYLDSSIRVDRAALPFLAGISAVWSALAVAGLLLFVVPGTPDTASLAIAVGGVLFAGRALGSVTSSLAALGRAAIAWREIGPIFKAASQTEPPPPFLPPSALREDAGRPTPLLDVAGVSFGYGGHKVLEAADLVIQAGDRLLLEGASGGGKSTLASLLVGIRSPDSGQVLLRGHDRQTLGDGWHKLVTEAPQFHENHILVGSLGFNLLLGRQWPATKSDLAEARQICDELGLGDLVDRMPGGLNQMVGETGWQLSHGERSRIFLARALLQNAELTILDESFAALDPESLRLCLDCAFRRARTLLVIAHP